MTVDVLKANATYKYTFPVEKSFLGEDGKPRLVGYATGPEVDLEDQRVSPGLIKSWADKINRGEMQLVYRDYHRKDTAIEDLGFVEKAWVNEEGHLGVQIVLDEDNPVSQYIHKAAAKGKQYGMSIHGTATRFVREVVPELGKTVVTIMDGTLDEISHTTRPIWTPSFGTVLAKAIDSSLESANGDKSVDDDKTVTPQKSPEELEAEKSAEAKAAAATTDSGAEVAPDPDTGSAEAVVEKAVRAETKTDAKKMAQILSLHTKLGQALEDAGFKLQEDTAGDDKGKEVEKSAKADEAEDDRILKIEKSLETLVGVVTTLADSIPDGSAPGVLRKSEPIDPLAELKAVADPMERFRLAIAAQHGGTSTLR